MTRRAVLAGAGGLAGAAALHAARLDEVGAVEASTPRLATAEAPGGPPLAVVPGVQVASWGATAFHAVTPADGRAVTAGGAYTNLDDGYLTADLDLPDRVRLLSAQVCGTNTTGSLQYVYIQSQSLTTAGGANFGIIGCGSGAGLQTWQASIDQVLDVRANSYSSTLYTYAAGTFRIRSLRLAFQPNEQSFVATAPTRVYDSRAGNPPLAVTKGPLGNGTRVIDLMTGIIPGVAPYPRGVLVNLTVVNTSASGFLSLYANGTSFPGTSSINWFAPNEIVANTTYTAVDTAGKAIALVPANASTDFFIDRIGLFL